MACSTQAQPRTFLELRQVHPSQAEGLFLNEPVVLHFSEELDPTSVHPLSVSIRSESGRLARGSWEVVGRSLTFRPDPPLRADLMDGGYEPGRVHELTLAGFPRLDGLRGASGAYLARGVRWRFRTAGGRNQADTGLLFEDSSLGVAKPLVLLTTEIEPTGEIRLESGEPLDPRTVDGRHFALVARAKPDSAPVPLRARLLENHDKSAFPRRGTALLVLTPAQRLEPGEIYTLELLPARPGLQDFGGNPLHTIAAGIPGARAVLRVRAPEADASDEPGFLSEEFESTDLRSVEAVPSSAGTALWRGTGKVELLWPMAAGDGALGHVALDGYEARVDLCAERLELPRGVACTLSERPGPVLLRSQGALRLDGTLQRRTKGPGPPSRPAPLLRSDLALEPDGPLQLSLWLERLRERNVDVTVLLAGGDLTLAGEIEVDGPLFLIAGGHVRRLGAPPPRAQRAWVLSSFGGSPPDYRPIGSAVETPMVDLGGPAPMLVLDPPASGEPLALVNPLTFSVLSAPIPRVGSAARWYASLVAAQARAGAVRVRYFADGDAPGDESKLVDDPQLLGDAPALRLRIDLILLPGGVWDPPFVERVQLRWEPREGGK